MLDFFAEASVLTEMALHGTKVQKETSQNSLHLGTSGIGLQLHLATQHPYGQGWLGVQILAPKNM